MFAKLETKTYYFKFNMLKFCTVKYFFVSLKKKNTCRKPAAPRRSPPYVPPPCTPRIRPTHTAACKGAHNTQLTAQSKILGNFTLITLMINLP